jgi:hypothetical protein
MRPRLKQIHMCDTQRLCEFVQRHNCGVPFSLFESADILLAETRPSLHLLLSEAFLSPKAREVLTNQPSHIHARMVASLHTIMLRTIVCILLFECPLKKMRTVDDSSPSH